MSKVLFYIQIKQKLIYSLTDKSKETASIFKITHRDVHDC